MHHFFQSIGVFFSNSIVENVIASIIFALLLQLLNIVTSLWSLKRRFHNAVFNLHLKGVDGKEGLLVRTATIAIGWWDIVLHIRPVMKIHSTQVEGYKKGDLDPFWGEFTFNPINKKYGTGIIYHDNDRFNFPKVLAKDKNTIYTQSTWLSHVAGQGPTVFKENPIAFVWKRKKV